MRACSRSADGATLVRQAGLVIVTATATHWALLQLTWPMSRPAAPGMLRLLALAAGLALVLWASSIARAWPASTLRRLWHAAVSADPGAAPR